LNNEKRDSSSIREELEKYLNKPVIIVTNNYHNKFYSCDTIIEVLKDEAKTVRGWHFPIRSFNGISTVKEVQKSFDRKMNVCQYLFHDCTPGPDSKAIDVRASAPDVLSAFLASFLIHKRSLIFIRYEGPGLEKGRVVITERIIESYPRARDY
jgi:hypothetical protein